VAEQNVEITGQGVVVVACGGLARPAESAPVICDAPVPGGQQHPSLPFPRMTAVERIAADEHHRLAAAMILIVNLDIGVVLGANTDVGHDSAWPQSQFSAGCCTLRRQPDR
jgi:hypothetical protein